MSGYAQPVLASQGRLDPGVTLIEKPFTGRAFSPRSTSLSPATWPSTMLESTARNRHQPGNSESAERRRGTVRRRRVVGNAMTKVVPRPPGDRSR